MRRGQRGLNPYLALQENDGTAPSLPSHLNSQIRPVLHGEGSSPEQMGQRPEEKGAGEGGEEDKRLLRRHVEAAFGELQRAGC